MATCGSHISQQVQNTPASCQEHVGHPHLLVHSTACLFVPKTPQHLTSHKTRPQTKNVYMLSISLGAGAAGCGEAADRLVVGSLISSACSILTRASFSCLVKRHAHTEKINSCMQHKKVMHAKTQMNHTAKTQANAYACTPLFGHPVQLHQRLCSYEAAQYQSPRYHDWSWAQGSM